MPFGTWQFGKIGVLVNFRTIKLKSKHLVCLSFLWFFEGMRKNILYIFRALVVLGALSSVAVLSCVFLCTFHVFWTAFIK